MRQHPVRMLMVVALASSGLLVVGSVSAGASPALDSPGPVATQAASQLGQLGQPALASRVVQGALTSASAASVVSTRPRGARPTQPSRSGTAATTATAATAVAPAAAAPAIASAAANRLLANFNGTSSRDSQFTNFNAKFEPPDQGLCVGAGFILEPVNSAYRIYRTNGQSIRGPFNVNDIFNEGAKEYTSDPRCWYDQPTHTWFATILFLNDAFTEGRIDIAVNPHSNPTGAWTQYQIDATFDGRDGEPNLSGCPCFGDQPRIGIDQTNLYVTTDEFSINGPQFHGGQIYAISKADLISGAAKAHFVHFGNLRIGGAMASAPQPALTIGSSPAEYFLGSLDPGGAGDNRLGVWAMTDRGKVATGGSPTLTKLVVGSEPYSSPPAARQLGASSVIDPGDDRMQQASFVGGTLWGTLGTSLRPKGDTKDRAGIAWFQLQPKLAGNAVSSAGIVRQGYQGVSGESLLYPAVQPDAAGNAGMVFTITGKDRYPSAAYSVLTAGAATFAAPFVAAAGTGPYFPKSTRWGDYSFAVPDWSSDAVWLATEYIPPKSSQTTNGQQNWGTRVLKVRLG